KAGIHIKVDKPVEPGIPIVDPLEPCIKMIKYNASAFCSFFRELFIYNRGISDVDCTQPHGEGQVLKADHRKRFSVIFDKRHPAVAENVERRLVYEHTIGFYEAIADVGHGYAGNANRVDLKIKYIDLFSYMVREFVFRMDRLEDNGVQKQVLIFVLHPGDAIAIRSALGCVRNTVG